MLLIGYGGVLLLTTLGTNGLPSELQSRQNDCSVVNLLARVDNGSPIRSESSTPVDGEPRGHGQTQAGYSTAPPMIDYIYTFRNCLLCSLTSFSFSPTDPHPDHKTHHRRRPVTSFISIFPLDLWCRSYGTPTGPTYHRSPSTTPNTCELQILKIPRWHTHPLHPPLYDPSQAKYPLTRRL